MGESLVRVKLIQQEETCKELEFEVEFAGINKNQEVTVNWIDSSIQNNGVFYSDSNGLEMIKRTVQRGIDDDGMPSLAAANYYPINSAVFVENSQSLSSQMIVMNDRAQAGSGFRSGHIELMFNRRTFTRDELGNDEPLDEKNPDGTPLRTHNKYYVAFTNKRSEAFEIIAKRSMLTNNPLQMI